MSDSLDAIPVITGSVIDSSAFKKGGSLVLGSFEPGPGAAADDETDQLSLMMIKGIKDTLLKENTRFIIPADGAQNSAFYLEGSIKDYDRRGHFAHLSIDGEIGLSQTGEEIFMFQTSAKIDLKGQNPKAVAYRIGVAIAHFIGRGSS